MSMKNVETQKENNVIFFRPADRGARNIGDKTFRMLFISRPKGVRFNAPIAKRFAAHNVDFVEVGVIDDKAVFVKPSSTKEGSFKLSGSASTMQVTSHELYDWAESLGLVNKRIIGEWDDKNGFYRFDISGTDSEDVDEEEEDNKQ